MPEEIEEQMEGQEVEEQVEEQGEEAQDDDLLQEDLRDTTPIDIDAQELPSDPTPPPLPTPPPHHPEFYFPDGTVIFKESYNPYNRTVSRDRVTDGNISRVSSFSSKSINTSSSVNRRSSAICSSCHLRICLKATLIIFPFS